MNSYLFNQIEEKFKSIINKEITPINNSKSAIGRTFENSINLSKNDLPIPDYNNIEIKCHLDNSKYPINLFSLEPKGKTVNEGERLRLKYGKVDAKYKKINVLYLNLSCNNYYEYNDYYFKLEKNKAQQITLNVYNENKVLIDNITYWNIKEIKERIIQKMPNLVIIKAIRKNNKYKYVEMQEYKNVIADNFIELLLKGIVRIKINIGITYYNGNFNAKNHGSTFTCYQSNIYKIYEKNKIYK